MKKLITAIAVFLLALVGAGSGYIASENLGNSVVNGNVLQFPTQISTSTGSYASNVPVKLLDRDNDRQYARIQNNSNSVVCLYLADGLYDYNFTEMATGYTSVTSTVDNLDELICLSPYADTISGDTLFNFPNSYEITPDNLFIGQVWATSTDTGLKIQVIYE